MDINNRIRTFLKYKKITVQKFESSIRKTNGYLAHTKSPTAGVISDIMSIYSDLNIEWLLTGKGDMLKSTSSGTSLSDQKEMEYKNTIRGLEAEVNQLKGENRILREQAGLGERKANGKSA